MKGESLILLALCIALASSKGLSQFRIFGGEDATEGQFPYQASYRNKHTNKQHCGAAIISDRYLLTAAHCCKSNFSNPDYVKVVVGALRRSYGGMALNVDKIVAHENHNNLTAENDIALIRTATKIVFNTRVQPIFLPNEHVANGKQLIVTGWGTNGTTRFELLQYVEVQVLSVLECKKFYVNKTHAVRDSNICTIGKTNDHQPCKGCIFFEFFFSSVQSSPKMFVINHFDFQRRLRYAMEMIIN